MISEDMVIYLLFNLIIFAITLVGIKKLPILLFFTLLGTILISVGTITAFDGYEEFGLMLILMNAMIPVIILAKSVG